MNLFSDGEKRRSNQAERREFQKTKDTFACRFYQRMVEDSPCERFSPALTGCHFLFALHSDLDDAPLANLPFRIDVTATRVLQGTTDVLGNLEAGDVEPGDFKLTIANTSMTVPALNKSEGRRRLRVRQDLPLA